MAREDISRRTGARREPLEMRRRSPGSGHGPKDEDFPDPREIRHRPNDHTWPRMSVEERHRAPLDLEYANRPTLEGTEHQVEIPNALPRR